MGVEDLPISCYIRIIVYASNAEAILTIIFSFVRWFSHFMVLGVSIHSTNTKHLLLTRHCNKTDSGDCIVSNADKMPILRCFIVFITIAIDIIMTVLVYFVVSQNT